MRVVDPIVPVAVWVVRDKLCFVAVKVVLAVPIARAMARSVCPLLDGVELMEAELFRVPATVKTPVEMREDEIGMVGAQTSPWMGAV